MDKIKYHIRNKNICVSLMILLLLLQAALGFSMAVHYHKIGRILDKTEMLHMRLGINLIWGLFFSILFAWYMLTLEFTKKWWIFPTLLIVWFFSIYLNLLPWLILIALVFVRYRRICKVEPYFSRKSADIAIETEEVIEKVVKEGKPRISGPAIFGFLLSIFCIFVPIIGQLICFYVCGKVLYEIKKSNGLLKGRSLAIGGIVISAVILIGFVALIAIKLSSR